MQIRDIFIVGYVQINFFDNINKMAIIISGAQGDVFKTVLKATTFA